MVEPFIFIQTAPIKEGMLETYKKDIQDTANLVEAEEPRGLLFASYINEEGTEQPVIQVHPDPECMRFHMQIAAQHIRERRPRNLDSSRMRIDVYGTPTARSTVGRAGLGCWRIKRCSRGRAVGAATCVRPSLQPFGSAQGPHEVRKTLRTGEVNE